VAERWRQLSKAEGNYKEAEYLFKKAMAIACTQIAEVWMLA
jgi:hypothetical protein